MRQHMAGRQQRAQCQPALPCPCPQRHTVHPPCVPTHHSAIQHSRPHADEHVVLDGARVDSGAVACQEGVGEVALARGQWVQLSRRVVDASGGARVGAWAGATVWPHATARAVGQARYGRAGLRHAPHHAPRHATPRTNGDVVADDGGLGLAVNAVPGHVHDGVVLDVGVAAHLNGIQVPCSSSQGRQAPGSGSW